MITLNIQSHSQA